jgi:hypothetical protein
MNQNYTCSTTFSAGPSISNLIEILKVVLEMKHKDGLTDTA